MASRKVREMIRLRRMEFDKQVEKAREVKALDGMTKAQLIEYAEEHGIEVDRAAKKVEIRETINKR